MDNPIGEDLRHVSYHLNCVADEIARITNLLPKKNKEEIDRLVKITIQMKSKLNQTMDDINESRNTLINIAEEIELAKLSINKEIQDQASGGTEHLNSDDELDGRTSSSEFYDCEI